jgi:hypothetical protein
LANEQPVLFSEGRGPDGVFHEVLVDFVIPSLMPTAGPISPRKTPATCLSKTISKSPSS